VLEIAIFYFLLALEAEKFVGQQISNPVLGLGLDREHTTRVQLQTSLGSNFVKPEA
jgi:hypothetical protein